jgi:uncharacterized OB-fold protein
MSAARPLPVITADNLPFWRACAEQRLVLPFCNACDRHFYPIGPVCPHCFADRPDWRDVSGRGVVSSFVIYHQAFFAFYSDRLPYAVVQVELPEGPRLVGNMLGIDPRDVRIGMPVEVTFEKVTDEITLPQFQPVRSR